VKEFIFIFYYVGRRISEVALNFITEDHLFPMLKEILAALDLKLITRLKQL
jgi:hypothetical protein